MRAGLKALLAGLLVVAAPGALLAAPSQGAAGDTVEEGTELVTFAAEAAS